LRKSLNLRNFKLEEITEAIAFEGLGSYWDIHAYAKLIEARYYPVENTVELHWNVPEVENPWGDKDNHAKGCILRFSDVSLLKVKQTEAPNTNEDDCVAGVSQISTETPIESDPVELRMRRDWKQNDDFGLLFELQSGRTIEIHSQSAELIPI
jgi:hypothetical protein